MDSHTKSLLEAFNFVLNELKLENNIFGWIAIFLILSISAIITVFTFACLVRKLKSCNNKSNFEEFGAEI